MGGWPYIYIYSLGKLLYNSEKPELIRSFEWGFHYVYTTIWVFSPPALSSLYFAGGPSNSIIHLAATNLVMLVYLSFPNTTSTKLYPRALLEVWLFPGLSGLSGWTCFNRGRIEKPESNRNDFCETGLFSLWFVVVVVVVVFPARWANGFKGLKRHSHKLTLT